MALLGTLRRLPAERSGVAALEFALAAPVVVLSVTGLMELSMVMFVSSLMEGGAARGLALRVSPATYRLERRARRRSRRSSRCDHRVDRHRRRRCRNEGLSVVRRRGQTRAFHGLERQRQLRFRRGLHRRQRQRAVGRRHGQGRDGRARGHRRLSDQCRLEPADAAHGPVHGQRRQDAPVGKRREYATSPTRRRRRDCPDLRTTSP